MASSREEVPVWKDNRRGYSCPFCLRTPLTVIAGQVALKDRSVSRQHLTVEVGEVGAKDCVRDPEDLLGAQAYCDSKAEHEDSIAGDAGGPEDQTRDDSERRADQRKDLCSGERLQRRSSCAVRLPVKVHPFFLFPSAETYAS